MDYNDICERIRNYLLTSFPNPAMELTNDTPLLDGWFIDSMGVVQVVMFLEQEFGCEIRAADVNAENLRDVDSLARFVLSKSGVSCN